MSSIYDRCNDAGGMSMYEWERDPKRIAFILARYKFVSKMFDGKGHVLEVGCSDGFGSRLVAQTVEKLVGIDRDAAAIEIAKSNSKNGLWGVDFVCADFADYQPSEKFDAVYALDVLEHIDPIYEQQFLEHFRSVAPIAIIGMPSLESQQYASELSKIGHVNCKTAEQLKLSLRRHWDNVFLFGMNDEVLHTGFGPMCQYRLAICT